MTKTLLLVGIVAALASCSSDGDNLPDADLPEGEAATEVGACDYESPFTRAAECREYDASWTAAQIADDCADLAGTVTEGCSSTYVLGRCALESEDGRPFAVVSYGEADGCDLQKAGCETFGGGAWTDGAVCSDGGGSGGGNVFIQPTRICVEPLEDEPPGQSEGGQVCTWQAVSGSTEQGRRFGDYASCDIVRTQRPYYPAQPADTIGAPDPRMEDTDYVEELAWVRSQIESSACVCCHSTEDAPQGTSNWFLEAPVNWVSSMGDSGVALGANAVSSIAFGAYPPADNNGFDRVHSGFPSTDPDRMVAFFKEELTYRGLAVEDFADAPGFGGPLYDQIFFEPAACENGEGVTADGRIVWAGGPARYLYVLEADSQSPTVPPNLDRPDGTRWRIDVPADGAPMIPGEVVYGVVPAGQTQAVPPEGAPAGLASGSAYYLYASLDVGIPVTRCLFTAP